MSGYHADSIDAEEVIIGIGVEIHPTAIITGYKRPARRVVLGDHCYIGEGVRIMVPEFELGDYSKLNAGAYSYGKGYLKIGRNCWFGGNTVLDAKGGLRIDDNCTVSAGVKIWTHFFGGDYVRGGSFDDYAPIVIGKDTWLGCDCVVSKSTAPESMFLPMTNVCRTSERNRTYAGNPMTDITEKIGAQFKTLTDTDKELRLEALKQEFIEENPQYRYGDLAHFDSATNTYKKKGLPAEVAFIKAMMPRIRMLPE